MLQKIKWGYNRWTQMEHPKEDWYRIQQQFQYRVKDRVAAKKFTWKLAYKFIGLSKYELDASLLKNYFDQKDIWNIKIFNLPLISLKADIHWRKDYKNNIISPLDLPYRIDTTRIQSSGEYKYLLELNRFHHFPTLAAYHFAYQDQQSLCVIKNHIRNWHSQNPYLKGINWKSGIEVAIRAINFVYARQLLRNISDKQFLEEFDNLILLHLKFLLNHLSLYSSANNHLLAEVAGIVIISSVYEFKNSTKILDKYFQVLQQQILLQFFEDGMNKEQAIHYHAAALNTVITAIVFANNKKLHINKKVEKRIGAAFTTISTFSNTNGVIDNIFGDSDDSQLVYPYFEDSFNIYKSLIQTGYILYNAPYCLVGYDKIDFRNYLLTGANKPINKSYLEKRKRACFLPKSGYFIFNNLRSKLVFDVGSLGFGVLAAHGHSDLLNFTFSYKEIPFIVDCGTYQYQQDFLKWRNYFRGITSHNTISVENLHHSTMLGIMLWGKKPTSKVESYQTETPNIYCQASHNAFINQGVPIHHQRKITCIEEKNMFEITDYLHGDNSFRANYYLHFHPEITTILQEEETLTLIHEKGTKIRLKNTLFKEAVLVKGDEQLPLGWYSPTYDVKQPTTTLFLKIKSEGSITITTHILYGTKET